MSEQKELEEFLLNIKKGLLVYDIKEFSQVLSEILSKKSDKDKDVELVLDVVCKNFEVSRRILIHGKSRDSNIARKLAYCLLHYTLGIPVRHISKRIFFKWNNSIYTYIKEFKTNNPTVKSDREFKEVFDKLQLIVLEELSKTQKAEA